MSELVIIIWTILVLVLGLLLNLSLKQSKRKLGKYTLIYKLLLIIVSFLVSVSVFYWLKDDLKLVWLLRLSVLLLGIVNVYVLYKRPWTRRNTFDYQEDAFVPEFLFVSISGCIASIIYTGAPQIVGILPYRENVSRYLWDLPIIFVLPFLVFKLSDWVSQKPFKQIENPWVFPVEKIDSRQWKWIKLMQLNFQLKKSLKDEYDFLRWEAKPWVEVPQEVSLGQAFRLCIQERRGDRSDLVTIQDLGDEYDGMPVFCWIFYLKKKWFNPLTWFVDTQCLNPDISIEANGIKTSDVIIARRIPGDGQKVQRDYSAYETDPDKTIIINR